MLLLYPVTLFPLTLFPIFNYPSPTQDLVTVIEDGSLARRDGALRLIKDYSCSAISKGRDRCCGFDVTIPYPHLCSDWCCRIVPGNPVNSGRLEFPAQ